MDRGDWRAIVHGVAKSLTQLSDWAQTPFIIDFFPFFPGVFICLPPINDKFPENRSLTFNFLYPEQCLVQCQLNLFVEKQTCSIRYTCISKGVGGYLCRSQRSWRYSDIEGGWAIERCGVRRTYRWLCIYCWGWLCPAHTHMDIEAMVANT